MDYLKPKMSIDLGATKVTDDEWDRIFGKKPKCPTCNLKAADGPFCKDAFHLADPQESVES